MTFREKRMGEDEKEENHFDFLFSERLFKLPGSTPIFIKISLITVGPIGVPAIAVPTDLFKLEPLTPGPDLSSSIYIFCLRLTKSHVLQHSCHTEDTPN